MKFITALEKYLNSRGISYVKNKNIVTVGTEIDDIPVDFVLREPENGTAVIGVILPTEINAARTETMITAANVVNAGTDFGKFSVSAGNQTLGFSGYVRLHESVCDQEISYLLGMTNAIMTKFGKPLIDLNAGRIDVDGFVEICTQNK